MIQLLRTQPEHQQPGSVLRLVTADALQEHGREHEAHLLRSPERIYFHRGHVYHATAQLGSEEMFVDGHRDAADQGLHSVRSFSPETKLQLDEDARHFFNAHASAFQPWSEYQSGRRLWMSRNRDMGGFADAFPGRYRAPDGTDLSPHLHQQAMRMGEYHLHDDPETGEVHGQSMGGNDVLGWPFPQPGLDFDEEQPQPTPNSRMNYARPTDTLQGLLRAARENPYDANQHGVIADALQELMPDSPVPEMIRKQYGVGNYGGQGEQGNAWHPEFESSYDGTHPYFAPIGDHGPFKVYLGHEGTAQHQGPNQRWIVRLMSNLSGSRDSGYNFEFSHDQAHLIPLMFPGARLHISSDPNAFAPSVAVRGLMDRGRYRDEESQMFDNEMNQQWADITQ